MIEHILKDSTLITPGLLIPLFPLIGFLINGIFGKYLPKSLTGWIATLLVLASFVCSFYLFYNLNQGDNLNLDLYNWIALGNFTISFGFLIDPLTLVMLMVVTGVGFLIHLYSIGYMHNDEGFTRFFTYLNLFIVFMLLLVMGNNYLVMFIGWEGVGLCSYLLIGFWFKNDAFNDAAKKAFIMNRIGDLGFLLAMFFMLFHFGTLDFATVAEKGSLLAPNSKLLIGITLLLFVGATGKSAQIPLYTWLPDAMAGPTPVSALIHAATMVTAGIYMIARSHVLYTLAPFTSGIVLVIGVLTALFAAVIGLKQTDIKKVLAYSTVSQLGYMFAALGVGAYKTAIFHLVTHAFFKALLFLGSGSVIHAMSGEQDIRKMGGLKKALPITHLTFLIGTLAIAGCPPLAGFFSKDEILASVYGHSSLFFTVLAFTSILTAVYMFRLYFLTFLGKFRGTEEQKHHLHESPFTMTVPLIVLAILAFTGGFLGMPEIFHAHHRIGSYLGSVIPVHTHEVSHFFEYSLIALSIVFIALIIYLTYKHYVLQGKVPENESEMKPGAKLIYNKFYVDEVLDKLFVKPMLILSDLFLVLIDKLVIDLIVNATAWFVGVSGRTLRLIQSGNTGFYVFTMVIGMVVLFVIRMLI